MLGKLKKNCVIAEMGNTLAQWRCAIGTFNPKARGTILDEKVPLKPNKESHLTETMQLETKGVILDVEVPLTPNKKSHLAEAMQQEPKSINKKVNKKVKENNSAGVILDGRQTGFLLPKSSRKSLFHDVTERMLLVMMLVAVVVAILLMRAGIEPHPGPPSDTQVSHAYIIAMI